jgi:hypothetical protein
MGSDYGEVALTGKAVHFDSYSPVLKRHYDILAYRPAQGRFAVLFTDVTERKRAEHQSAANLDAMTRLQKLGTMFVREGDLESVLGEIVEAAMAIAAADFGSPATWPGFYR